MKPTAARKAGEIFGEGVPAIDIGEVSDRRTDGEGAGLVATSGDNLFAAALPLPSSYGMFWFPPPERSNRTLKLQGTSDLAGNLARDAARIVESSGVPVTRPPAHPEPAPLRMSLEILELDASSSDTPTNFFGKGTITVRFGFSATLVDGGPGRSCGRGGSAKRFSIAGPSDAFFQPGRKEP